MLGHHHHRPASATTSPRRRSARSTTSKCHANQGFGGFDIDVVRYFTPVGANTGTRDDEVFHTTYTPSDTVVCTNPDAVDE